MDVDLDNYDIHHKNTGAIRIRIPRTVFVLMLMALSHCIEKYIAGINSIALTCDFWRIDDELDELNQSRESAENLRKGISDRLLTPDSDEEVLWACGEEKVIADIIEYVSKRPQSELTDWVQELKRGEHKF